MRPSIALLAFISFGTAGAVAQPARTTRDAYACVDPNAVRALSNTAEPRRYDRDWVNYVVRKGNCGTLPAGTAVNKSGSSDELSSVQVTTQGQSAQLYIQGSNLNPDPVQPPPEPPATTAVAAAEPALDASPAPESGDDLAKLVDKLRVEPRRQRSSWKFSRSEGGSGCQIDGFTKPGHTVIVASADHPGVVRLVLQKTSWRIPPATPVSASVSFSDGGNVPLEGVGNGSEIAFDLTEATLKPWLRGFTSTPAGKVAFTSGNEPAWKLDLSGTPMVVNTLRRCIVDAKLNVPPPLAETPTQPFSASNSATQPFGMPAPAKPEAAPSPRSEERIVSAPPPTPPLPAPPAPIPPPPAPLPPAAPARLAAARPAEAARPAPPTPPAAPSTLSWNDIPRLKQEFDASGGAFKGEADPVFSAQGVFLGFTTADAAEQGKSGLWMAIVDSAPATEPNAFCLFTNYRSDLAQLRKGQPVRISGKVVVPMEGSVALERNCSVTPG